MDLLVSAACSTAERQDEQGERYMSLRQNVHVCNAAVSPHLQARTAWGRVRSSSATAARAAGSCSAKRVRVRRMGAL